MKNGGTIAAIGAMALAVLCCVGIPLLIGAVAAVGVSGVLGGVGVAAAVALIAAALIFGITRLRQHRA